jgi:glycosyltransferase involved in cell wall biosynthesis
LRRDFDVIQYHALGSAPLSLLPRLWGRTTVVSVRGLDWEREKWGPIARAFLKACEWTSARCPTATVVVSQTLQRHYAETHGRVPHFIPNAVVSCARRAAERITRYGLQKDGFLLFAGRLSPEKGVHVLLDAMRPLRHPMKLALAGGTSYSDGYIDALRHASWGSVVFLGSVDRETMQELYSNCYAFVLPSAMEGLSVSLLEALSYGACIITTDIPENVEVVGPAALVFPPGDIEALRDILRQVLERPALVQAYRRRSTERTRERPDWDEVARRSEALYYRLLRRSLEGNGDTLDR